MTNSMTPTGQDKLREQVHKLFGDYQADDGGYQSCYDGKWIDMTNEVCAVADFITADRKRVVLEARLDELREMSDLPYIGLRTKRLERLGDRAAELKQELEKL